MNQLEILLLVFVLAACGASDLGKTPTEGATETPPVSAMGTAPEVQPPTAPAIADALDPKVEICIDLVRSESYSEALPVCAAALETHPGNLELRHAADKARAETSRATPLAGAA